MREGRRGLNCITTVVAAGMGGLHLLGAVIVPGLVCIARALHCGKGRRVQHYGTVALHCIGIFGRLAGRQAGNQAIPTQTTQRLRWPCSRQAALA